MQNIYTWIGFLAALFSVFAYVRLAKLVTNPSSDVAPNPASWLVWLAVDGSIFVSSLAAGVTTTMAVFAVYTIGCLVIVVLVFRTGKIEWKPFDVVCLVTSAIAFVAWKMTGDPKIAIYLNIAVATAGTVPTIAQGWLTPEQEDLRVWQYFLAGGFVNLFAVEKWDFVNGAPPVAVFILQVLLLSAVFLGKRKAKLEVG
ncbi:MAG: hypothetical protein AAB617_01055 [Patescibacteria group bacterium]